MKVFYNSKLAKLFTFMKGFKTIMLFGAVFTEHAMIDTRTKYHEQTHVTQYETMFFSGLVISIISMFTMFAFNIVSAWMFLLLLIPLLLYYAWYGVEYLIKLVKYKDSNIAYRNISFEKEARQLQDEYLKLCKNRRSSSSFSFLKYI